MFSVVFFCMKVEMQNRVDEIRNKKKKKKKRFFLICELDRNIFDEIHKYFDGIKLYF